MRGFRERGFRSCTGLGLLLAAMAIVAQAQSAPLPAGTSDTESASTSSPQAVAPLAEAEAKLDARDYPAAQSLLDAYLSAHPNDARALFDRGYLEDAEDHASLAEGYYRKAIAADPQQFESRLALGLILANRSGSKPADAAEARTQLEAATHLEPHPANPPAQAQASRALARLLRSSDPEAARQALLAALKLSPEKPADMLLTAEIAEAAGDQETAQEAFRKVLAASPTGSDSDDTLEATTGLTHLLIVSKQYPEAETLLRKSLAHNAADPVLNTQLADVLMAESKPDEAVAVLENLHAAQPNDRNVTRMLADLYTQGGQAEKADPLYMLLLPGPGTPGQDAGLLAARGDNLIRQKRYAEAIPVLERATRLNPQDGAAWSSLAFAASETHQPQMALDALAMRSKVMEETPATYFIAATSWDTLHQTKRAVEMYKQFLAVAGGKFPDQEWQAKHRLVALAR